jgi:hypothetical protein
MLNQLSLELILERLEYFENAGVDLLNLAGDTHFLSELTMFLMFMETEGLNSSATYHDLYPGVKKVVHDLITARI